MESVLVFRAIFKKTAANDSKTKTSLPRDGNEAKPDPILTFYLFEPICGNVTK